MSLKNLNGQQFIRIDLILARHFSNQRTSRNIADFPLHPRALL
jgi:hypothetical protein